MVLQRLKQMFICDVPIKKLQIKEGSRLHIVVNLVSNRGAGIRYEYVMIKKKVVKEISLYRKFSTVFFRLLAALTPYTSLPYIQNTIHTYARKKRALVLNLRFLFCCLKLYFLHGRMWSITKSLFLTFKYKPIRRLIVNEEK